MTLYQFNSLDEMEQTEVLWNSVFLAERVEREYKYSLYQYDSFYIELKRHIEHDVLHGMRSFISTEQLIPYLDKIDIK